jgi:hypothetical protein
LEARREEAVVNFRRLKFRLEKRYKNISADQFLFPEHEAMDKELRFEDEIEYEELLGYLRKKSESRRLTSLDQSKDNKISKSIRVLKVGEGVIPEGTVNSRTE